MAHTAHRDQRMLEEIFMTPAEIDERAEKVADLVRKAKSIVFATGAGVSTSAGYATDEGGKFVLQSTGIPDYRSKGIGVWTLAAEGRQRATPATPMHLAIPTLTHQANIAFDRSGKLSAHVSQNVDGLWLRSGCDYSKLLEVHGNSNFEECESCGKAHHREIMVQGDNQHYTGRKCVACGGALRDTIINFGENLTPVILENAYGVARSADLMIVLGTSLCVRPFCDLPRECKRNGGKVVIVNIQRTPLDDDCCDVRVHGRSDEFMSKLVSKLGWTLPPIVVEKQVTLLRGQRDITTTKKPASNNNNVRFCATVPGTNIPSSSFGTIEVFPKSNRKHMLASRDFTCEAASLDDICPTFELNKKEQQGEDEQQGGLVFHCESFYHAERHEPVDGLELVLPAGCDAATFKCSWYPFGSTYGEQKILDNSSKNPWKIERLPDVVFPDLSRGAAPTRVAGIKDKSGQDYTGWFSVTPLKDCPHTSSVKFTHGMVFDHKRLCSSKTSSCKNSCEETNNLENMMCLCCGEVFCGRHVEGHMQDHIKATGHQIVMGMKDLSCWCEACGSYIDGHENPRTKAMFHLMYRAKFGTDDPQEMADSAAAGAAAAATKKGSGVRPQNNNNNINNNNNNNNNNNDDDAGVATATMYDNSETKNIDTAAPQPDKTGFAVDRLPDCPHTSKVCFVENAVFDAHAPCESCGDSNENWMCLSCNFVGCSRYVKKHMLEHQRQTGHCMSASFSDMSVWCCVCDSYVSERNPKVAPFIRLLYMSKFGGEVDSSLENGAAPAQQQQQQQQSYSAGSTAVQCPHLFNSLGADCASLARLSSLVSRAAILRSPDWRRGDSFCAQYLLSQDYMQNRCEHEAGGGGGGSCTSTDTKVCLQCGVVLCGRYAASHMVEHADGTSHPCVYDPATSETWCYECDSFVDAGQVRTVMQTKGLM